MDKPKKLFSTKQKPNPKIPSDQLFNQYKQNVRLFINTITQQVQQLIDKYESKIQKLTKQNQILKSQQSLHNKNTQERTCKQKSNKKQNKSFKNVLDIMQTARSKFSDRLPHDLINDLGFSSVLSKYQSKNGQDNQFPLELINPQGCDDQIEDGRSRFLAKQRRKKHRQEQLIHFLQTGKNNLDATTSRFFESIGVDPKKSQKHQKNSRESKQIKKDEDQNYSFEQGHSAKMNRSLGDVCTSLDNSFVAKRARQRNGKQASRRMSQAKRMEQQKIIQKQKLDKFIKDKSIQGLLYRLRGNLQNTSQNPPEKLKISKLLSTGVKNKLQVPRHESPSRSGKVLINPVAVDIRKKSSASMMAQRNRQTSSPHKSPVSILKKSSLILSRSISAISAIQ